jgi:hypothetical protein
MIAISMFTITIFIFNMFALTRTFIFAIVPRSLLNSLQSLPF